MTKLGTAYAGGYVNEIRIKDRMDLKEYATRIPTNHQK